MQQRPTNKCKLQYFPLNINILNFIIIRLLATGDDSAIAEKEANEHLVNTLLSVANNCAVAATAEINIREEVDARMRQMQTNLTQSAAFLFAARTELEEKSTDLIR